MKQKRSVSGVPAGLVAGLLVFMMIMLTVVIIVAALIYQHTVEYDHGIYGVMLALLAGSFAGSFTAASIVGEKTLLVCLVEGAVYWVALLVLKLMFFENGFANVLLTMLLVMSGSVAASFVKLGKKGRGYAARRRHIRTA